MIPGPAFAASTVRTPVLTAAHPAVRFGGCVLGLATCFVVPAAVAPAVALVASLMAARTGLGPAHQVRALRAWRPIALLVLGVHTLTTTAAAPLGHPSLAGLVAGVVALLRVAASAGVLSVFMRTTNLDELVGGLRWWVHPLRRIGVDDEDLGLVVAVAMGTAPGMLGEARRIEAVTRLRSTGPDGAVRRSRLDRVVDRARVVAPVLESLGRRAEALSLSLRRRRPRTPALGGPPAGQLIVLVLWLVALVLVGTGYLPGGLR